MDSDPIVTRSPQRVVDLAPRTPEGYGPTADDDRRPPAGSLVDRLGRLVARPGASIPIILAAVTAAISYPVFLRMTVLGTGSDMPAHAMLVKKVIESGQALSYSAWYPLLNLLAGGPDDMDRLLKLTVLVLVMANVAKVVLTYHVALRLTRSPVGSAVTAAVSLLAMPVLNPMEPRDIYLGQITPNVWHNSTLIFAMPLAIAAFVAGVALCSRLTWRRAAVFGALLLLSTLAKPNFTLILGPVLGLYILAVMWRRKFRLRPGAAIITLAFVPALALLGYQYVATYVADSIVDTTIVLAPFATWESFSTNIPLSLLLSVAGPALVFVAVNRDRRSLLLKLSWLTLLVALLQIALLGERLPDGTISGDGNFFWGAYAAMQVVFICSMIALVNEMRAWRRADAAAETSALPLGRALTLHGAILAMALHCATGIYYLSRIGIDDFLAF